MYFKSGYKKHIFHTFSVFQKILRTHHELIRTFDIQGDSEISLEKKLVIGDKDPKYKNMG
jgi:hypothetical protein